MLKVKDNIYVKTASEIQAIRESGLILSKLHGELSRRVQAGVKTLELDAFAEEYILSHSAKPSFKGYRNFPATLCISVNSVVVHGIPNHYTLKDGDIISIDCGVFFNGFHSDSAYTYKVGTVNADVQKLLDETYTSLIKGIAKCKAGNRVGDISAEIQRYSESFGYGIVRELVGHGVGRNLHEAPEVPNFGKPGKGPKLMEGMVIAIEPMVTMGKRAVKQEKDGWTIKTMDGLPAAHFEHTVAIVDGKPEALTSFDYIVESQKVNYNG
ncbi:MAG TPA: type I methionyl aminopeptidase [Catalimonadaceae bacterium]|nr:type I methionyl aminopeptidase [Catalimonadaceae bacterium]